MKYDAIVIGAGPAGSTAALLLARAGWKVAVVEKSAFPRRKVCGEFISAPALALLAQAGVVDEVLVGAGPEVREVAVYAGEEIVTAPMPPCAVPRWERFAYGRALGREHLDARLLAAAQVAGAEVWQRWRVESTGPGITAASWPRDHISVSLREATRQSNPEALVISAPVVIAAHGSWDTGRLSPPGGKSNLLAFKAHFRDCLLPVHRMPLVAFPDGYGGLVTTDDGRVSFSCCITRDALNAARANAPGARAGDAVLAHVLSSSRGMREALGVQRSTRLGSAHEPHWLAAGPLQPGIHGHCGGGYFTIGNAHGEAHPIVAEGISMAIQSAWLLCERLVAAGPKGNLEAVAHAYERAYCKIFRQRIAAAALFAQIAQRPRAAAAAALLFRAIPPLMSLGARWAGKAVPLEARPCDAGIIGALPGAGSPGGAP